MLFQRKNQRCYQTTVTFYLRSTLIPQFTVDCIAVLRNSDVKYRSTALTVREYTCTLALCISLFERAPEWPELDPAVTRPSSSATWEQHGCLAYITHLPLATRFFYANVTFFPLILFLTALQLHVEESIYIFIYGYKMLCT